MKRFNVVLFQLLCAFLLGLVLCYYLHRGANMLLDACVVRSFARLTETDRDNRIPPFPVCYGVHYQLLPSYSSLYYAPRALAADARKKVLFIGDSLVDYALRLDAGPLMPPQNPVFSIPVGGISIDDMRALLDIYDRYYRVFAVRNVVVLGLTFKNFDRSAARQETIFNFNNGLPLAKTYEMAGDGACRRNALFPFNRVLNEVHIFYFSLYVAQELIRGSLRTGPLRDDLQAVTAHYEHEAGIMDDASWQSLEALVAFLHERRQRVVVVALPVRRAINDFPLQARFRERIERCSRQWGFDYLDRSSFLREDEFYSNSVFYCNYPGRARLTAAFADDIKGLLRND